MKFFGPLLGKGTLGVGSFVDYLPERVHDFFQTLAHEAVVFGDHKEYDVRRVGTFELGVRYHGLGKHFAGMGDFDIDLRHGRRYSVYRLFHRNGWLFRVGIGNGIGGTFFFALVELRQPGSDVGF